MAPLRGFKDPDLLAAWEKLQAGISSYGSLLVAFSGGVDSSLLLAAAKQALGPKVEAAICLGSFTPSWDEDLARRVAEELGVKLHIVQGQELDEPDIAANGPDRCYLCKRSRMTGLKKLADRLGLAELAEGSQMDDDPNDRPGARAVAELGVKSPLAAAGLDKAMVRKLSRELGLPTAQAPSSACLATRIPTGTGLTQKALARVDRAESALRIILKGNFRVRDHHPLARLEVEAGLMPLAVQGGLRRRIAQAVIRAGYDRVALDLTAYGEKPPAA